MAVVRDEDVAACATELVDVVVEADVVLAAAGAVVVVVEVDEVVAAGVVEAGAVALLVEDDEAPEWCFMKCSSLLQPASAMSALAQMRMEWRM